jgi:hypothetical protein
MMLRILDREGVRLVRPGLASGEIERWPEAAYAPLLHEHSRLLPLDTLDETLDAVITETIRHDAGIDRLAAPRIHRALPLTRREAADPGVWRFLTVVHRPDFVRHRWENRSWPTMRSRFWLPGTRPDSNAIARLWWIAELTRDGEDYDLTERVLARQSLANNLFVRDLASYRPAVEAFVAVLGDAPSDLLESAVRAFTRRLSTVVLEGQDAVALAALLQEIRGRA